MTPIPNEILFAIETQRKRLLEDLLDDAQHLKVAVADAEEAVLAIQATITGAAPAETPQRLAIAGELLRGAGTRIVLALLLVKTKAAKLEALSSVIEPPSERCGRS